MAQKFHRCPAPVSRILAMAVLACWVMPSARAFETVSCRLADGFDYPVGKPDASNYRKARGFWPNGHLGEDWNGDGGGDSDLGDPIYATGSGVVVLSEDVKVGWGNCVIIRHVFREPGGKIEMVDSLYGHLLERKVKVGEKVDRGQLIARMGSNNGMYPAHLHFEIRKNLAIGMNRTKFARDYSNYYSPTAFIKAHRQLQTDSKKYDIPVDTFAPHGKDLNKEQIAYASSRGSSTQTSSGDASGSSREASGVIKKSGGLSIPLTAGRGAGSSGSGKDSTVSKNGGKNDKKKTDPVPQMVPPTEPKSDFWSRLKSKLGSGEVTDGAGGGLR